MRTITKEELRKALKLSPEEEIVDFSITISEIVEYKILPESTKTKSHHKEKPETPPKKRAYNKKKTDVTDEGPAKEAPERSKPGKPGKRGPKSFKGKLEHVRDLHFQDKITDPERAAEVEAMLSQTEEWTEKTRAKLDKIYQEVKHLKTS